MFDVIIVGGGPAGLSAALVLGRACRRVLLCDEGRPRNDVSRSLHGFLSRDGADPAELRRVARAQLEPYGVEVRDVTVTDARRVGEGFEVTLADGARESGRALLLAGFAELYGRSAFTCPYCDGWEVRGRALAAYARGASSAGFALALTTWSDDVVLFTDGTTLSGDDAARLARNGVEVRAERVARFEGRDGALRSVVLEGGLSIERDALFFHLGLEQRSDLARRLGCEVTRREGVITGPCAETGVAGLYVAGDASVDVEFAIVAAAEGAQAARAIDRELRVRSLAS